MPSTINGNSNHALGLFQDTALPRLTAGIDEAGRGPLAGPVLAAAVILDPERPVDGLKDSKKLTAARRLQLAGEIRRCALAWALGRADVAEIDRMNILRASHLAMRRAVGGLGMCPDLALVDGNLTPGLSVQTVAVVGGDGLLAAISAASILAKVARDEEMTALSRRYPGYGLEQHKGYCTARHLAALAELGPTPEHRRSFAPVRAACLGQATQETPQ
jgi:ribonuclease HII